MSRLLRGSLLLIAVVFAGLLLQPGFADPPKGKKYALLVGVSYYKNYGYPHLKGTENDVVELAKLLRKPSAGFEVTLLTSTPGHKNKELAPTAANIRRELDKLLKGKGREDTVLIALAGHGADVEVDDPEKDPKKKKEANTYTYFFPTDADDLEDISHSTGHSDHLIEMGDLFRRLAAPKCGAGTKLVLIDACRDNFTATSSKRTTRGLSPTRATVPDGVSALFSCGPGEAALETGFDVGEEDKRIHGVFFWHVIEGLKGAAARRGGAVSWPLLTDYVQEKVPAFVKGRKVGGRRLEQTPHAIGNARERTVLVEAEEGVVVDEDKKDKPAKTKMVKDKKEEKEVTNTIGMKLVRIEPGSFLMGSPDGDKDATGDNEAFSDELPRHRVTISKAFYLGKHPVTVGEFRKFVEEEGYKTEAEKDGQGGYGYNAAERKWEGRKPIYTWKNPGWEQSDRHPVVNVTWNDAVAFCKWLSKKEEREYELPSEARWEYACRAGTTTRWYSGDAASSLNGIANIADKSLKAKLATPFGWERAWDDGEPFTSAVGKFGENPWGLCDMQGNVWQWCKDSPRKYDKEDIRDPEGSKLDRRVLRGGSWGDGARYCRAAYRNDNEPGCRSGSLGFRVALAPRTP